MDVLSAPVDAVRNLFGMDDGPAPKKGGSDAAPRKKKPEPTTFDPTSAPRPEAPSALEAAVVRTRRGTTDSGTDSSTSTHDDTGTTTSPQSRPARRARIEVADDRTLAADGSRTAVASSEQRGGDADALAALDNVQLGHDYLADTFGRDGFDGRGATTRVTVHDRNFTGGGGFYSEAAADGSLLSTLHLGDGESKQISDGRYKEQTSLANSDDLVVHELMHGVWTSETGDVGTEHGTEADESVAVNEAFADVMAASATRDWRLGEGMYTGSSDVKLMRNLASPDDKHAYHGLYTSIEEVEAATKAGDFEEHYASGVLSTAAARTQARLGGEAGWQAVENTFYGALTSGRLGVGSLRDAGAAIRAEAEARYGENSAQARAFDAELDAAGI